MYIGIKWKQIRNCLNINVMVYNFYFFPYTGCEGYIVNFFFLLNSICIEFKRKQKLSI